MRRDKARAQKAAKHLPAYLQDVAFTKARGANAYRKKRRPPDDADRWLAAYRRRQKAQS